MGKRKIGPFFKKKFKLPNIYATILKAHPEHQDISRTLTFLLSKGLNAEWIFVSSLKGTCGSLATAEVLPLSLKSISSAGQG